MSTGSVAAVLDYERMAADFDRYLPLLQPVAWALLDHLPVLSKRACVLDVACGTGEPGLSLARRSPGVNLLGIDEATGMVEVARAKAARENLSNVRFEVMSAERLACATGGADAVISRFGLLMFGDAADSAREMARVLRAGGSFSIAVWDDMALNTLFTTGLTALRPHLPAELLRPFHRMAELAAKGLREGLLREAGLTDVQSELFRWDMEFGNQRALSTFISGPGVFTRLFAALQEADRERVCSEAMAVLAEFKQESGSYRIPHACRLFWGSK